MSSTPAAAGASPWGALANAASSIYGYQNAGEQQQQGLQAGIGAEQTGLTGAQSAYGSALGNVSNYYGNALSADQNYWNPSLQTGNAAINTLGGVLGATGSGSATPNYSAFYNMPGYQFAVNQGTQAIQRQASAMGSAYTPNTMDAVGQYVTGTAMQDYNTYVNQLLNTAGLGQNAAGALTGAQTAAAGGQSTAQMLGAQGLSGASLNTAANIANLDAGIGQASATQQTGIGASLSGNNVLGTLLGSLFGGGSTNSNGASSPGLLSEIGGALSSGASSVGNFLENLLGMNNSGANPAATSSSIPGTYGNLGSGALANAYTSLGNLSMPSASSLDSLGTFSNGGVGTPSLLNDMTSQAGLGSLSSGNF
jgi:hypothetical protein